MINIDNKERKISQKGMIIRFFILIIYIGILIYIYFLLTKIGINPLISFLLLFFAFIFVLGPLISTTKASFYSRLFPKKSKKFISSYEEEKKLYKSETEVIKPQERKIKPVNLNFKYRKSLIHKCNKCGIIVPNFVNKCPVCGNVIKD